MVAISLAVIVWPALSRADGGFALLRRRHALTTHVFVDDTYRQPAAEPPRELFVKVRYPAPLGANVAYVSPPKKGARRPAIVWIAGGFDWGIDPGSWTRAPRENDQSARAFREAGIVLMRPALRGSNDNPGRNECFLGEVDDVLAAADFLAKRSDVDPHRIYLGGHSTGGTLALLSAESSDRFRAVFAFGPIGDPRHYGERSCVPAGAPAEELALRAPINFIQDIRTPTFVIEGASSGLARAFPFFEQRRGDAPVRFFVVPGASHFSVLAPGTEVIARAILADTAATPHFDFTAESLVRALTTDH